VFRGRHVTVIAALVMVAAGCGDVGEPRPLVVEPVDSASSQPESGTEFQGRVLEDGEVSADEYRQAIVHAVDCIRAQGFDVEFPVEGTVLRHVSVAPDKFLNFRIAVPEGIDTNNVARRCQETWSKRIELQWEEQLLPAPDARKAAIRSAIKCGQGRGQKLTGNDRHDAAVAVLSHGCKPWEDVEP
jgi:hypothetical protein